MRNRFETQQEKTEKGTPNDEYENFVNAHLQPRTKYRVPRETLAMREKRAHVKNVHTWKTCTREKLSKEPNKHKCPKTKNGTISIKVFIFVIRSMSFKYLLNGIKFISYIYIYTCIYSWRIFIAYIFIGEG